MLTFFIHRCTFLFKKFTQKQESSHAYFQIDVNSSFFSSRKHVYNFFSCTIVAYEIEHKNTQKTLIPVRSFGLL